jgi:hypothetical protein
LIVVLSNELELMAMEGLAMAGPSLERTKGLEAQVQQIWEFKLRFIQFNQPRNAAGGLGE